MRIKNEKKKLLLLKPTALALIEAASFLFLLPKIERYSEEQETASKINYYRLYLQFDIKH
ncbi:hypothetical protein [Flavobacterium hibisci]|uniref:hypothetical protein n=1 Tax=Flavobacterium hibisci TaxID=1914462 RepID=UPI001CBDA8B3|nr:hypothetical protein [Flavobacterium hibisci]MBZ4043455.1 hypothetical protein [Flavobacterium hibisci]